MKTAIGFALAIALALSVVPAVANDSFHAFSTLPALEQASLTPLSDDQLAAIEGEGFEVNKCFFCSNNAYIAQANLNASKFSKVSQKNNANVRQSIN
jgi:hypothetical protein